MVGPDYERHDASAPVAVKELAERRISEPAAVRLRAKIALSRRASMPIYDIKLFKLYTIRTMLFESAKALRRSQPFV
jgi:hypothetical protein